MRAIPASMAAQAFAGLASLDPRGITTEADIVAMCARSECLCIDVEGGQAAAAVRVEGNSTLWINAVRGQGTGTADLTDALDQALTEHARSLGLDRLGLQTARRGLVRKLEARGYYVAGWVMRKDVR